MLNITIRNLKIFFREKSSVFFSLLGVFVIIGLYILFLGDMLQQGISDLPGGRFLMDSWIMGGLLAVTSITTTMGAFGTMVEDKSRKITKDFYASPVKRSKIAGGYILSSYIIGVIMSVITFILAEIYIVLSGGELLSYMAILKSLGLILLTVFSSTSLVLFMVSFFNSNNAFATASTVLGTLIGFLTGIYIPVGSLPEGVQWAIKLFPPSHGGALFRQIFMKVPLGQSFKGAPIEASAEFNKIMGVIFEYGDYTMGAVGHILVLVATGVIFYFLASINLARKKS